MRTLIAVLGPLALFAAPALHAQPPGVTTSARPERPKMLLSESVRVTVTIEGPAKLRVEVPKQLLTADADAGWRIRPDGRDEPRVTTLPSGRERWEQVYRLDPYLHGELAVTFTPFTVNGRETALPPVKIAVTKTVGEPATTAPRPVTSVEDVPITPPPPIDDDSVGPWVAGAVALACAVLFVVRVRRSKPKPVSPAAWARAALAQLEASPARGAVVAERVAEVVREFVERRFAVPATKLTTTELSAAAAQQGWPVEEAQALRALLDECDRAKFAGDAPDDDGCRRLIRTAGDWVDRVGRPAGPG